MVESVKDKGSVFFVILLLPLATEAEQKEKSRETDDAEHVPVPETLSAHVLMAEDNEINASIVVEILGQHGVKMDVAENGRAAVDRFAAEPPGTYDLILMDVQMPVMDGRSAARAIRALPREDAKRIPICALSADAFVEDERQSRESGMNGYLTKPIDYDNLLRIIQRITAKGGEKE